MSELNDLIGEIGIKQPNGLYLHKGIVNGITCDVYLQKEVDENIKLRMEERIERVRDLMDQYDKMYDNIPKLQEELNKSKVQINEHLATIQAQANTLNSLYKRINELEKYVPNWYHVKDKLPEIQKDYDVVIVDNDGDVIVLTAFYDKDFGFVYDGKPVCNAVLWKERLPLPKITEWR